MPTVTIFSDKRHNMQLHPETPSDLPGRLPNLADPAERLRLSPAAIRGVIALAEVWRLGSSEASALLGVISERSWFRLKKPESAEPLSHAVLMRRSEVLRVVLLCVISFCFLFLLFLYLQFYTFFFL